MILIYLQITFILRNCYFYYYIGFFAINRIKSFSEIEGCWKTELLDKTVSFSFLAYIF